jgi:release factor glutamine methyltransferase
MSDAQSSPRPFADLEAAVSWALQQLKKAEVESPRLTAELLMAFVLGWDRSRVIAFGETRLSEADQERFESLVMRRARGEPLQYIVEQQEFYGRRFWVSPAVLIPRPETEILVEKALELAASRVTAARLRLLDVGTGSGCIAVSMIREVPHCEVWALDISASALAIARRNAETHDALSRIRLICSDLLDCFPPAPLFDGILSNPPYGGRRQKELFQRIVLEHEPHKAIFGGESGLEVFERLIPQGAARLRPNGFMLLEIGIGQSEMVAGILHSSGLILETILEDLQGIPRCAVAHKPER